MTHSLEKFFIDMHTNLTQTQEVRGEEMAAA